jgi:Protein of unknown function (DUF3175)
MTGEKPRQATVRKTRWSQRVTEHSNALDLDTSLKRSAETSKRHKADPYRSAMSMLVFYINRAGKTLPPEHKRLEKAQNELRRPFGRAPAR